MLGRAQSWTEAHMQLWESKLDILWLRPKPRRRKRQWATETWKAWPIGKVRDGMHSSFLGFG